MTYRFEYVTSSIIRMIDIAGVACYLVIGQNKACLLDTCTGVGDLKAFVQKLTSLKPFVILTHGHYDHTGSASLFDEVYMNPLDLPVLKKHNALRQSFLQYDQQNIPALKHKKIELNPLYTKTPLPLTDGQSFDLGGLTIRMIAVPGHTPGMMCAYIPEERAMLFGDACGMNVLLHDEFSSPVSTYRKSLLRLKTMENEYDLILRNHGSFTNDHQLLDEVIHCCDLILNGQDDHHPTLLYGKTVYEAKKRINGQRADGLKGNIIYALEKAH